MKKSYLLLGVVGVIIFSAIVLRATSQEDNWVCTDSQWAKHGNPKAARPTTLCPGSQGESLVGNDRDEHGCIASAGYSWCDLKEKCLRVWEEKCEMDIVTSTQAGDEPQASFSNEVVVVSPKQNELISSPLKIEGTATGNWFFEASLPIKLYDSNNNLIVAHFGTAQEDWMTEKPVRFTSELVYSTMATSGYLVISKDNPSGLPENDASIKIPIQFK